MALFTFFFSVKKDIRPFVKLSQMVIWTESIKSLFLQWGRVSMISVSFSTFYLVSVRYLWLVLCCFLAFFSFPALRCSVSPHLHMNQASHGIRSWLTFPIVQNWHRLLSCFLLCKWVFGHKSISIFPSGCFANASLKSKKNGKGELLNKYICIALLVSINCWYLTSKCFPYRIFPRIAFFHCWVENQRQRLLKLNILQFPIFWSKNYYIVGKFREKVFSSFFKTVSFESY